MSREYGIAPGHMAMMKPWHVEAMIQDLEERRKAARG